MSMRRATKEPLQAAVLLRVRRRPNPAATASRPHRLRLMAGQ